MPESLKDFLSFDPEGEGYDYLTALDAGLQPNSTGHWPSFDPRTGMLLKGRNHPTINLTLGEEFSRGNVLEKKGKRYFYKPAIEMMNRR